MHRTVVVAAGENRPLHDAFALGAALARPRGAEVVAVHVAIGGPDPEVPARLVALTADAPIDVPARAVAVSAPSITAGLHRVVTEEHADVLVVGSSHVGPITRATRGDIALGVVRDAPCALAMAPLGYAAKAPAEPRRIGVAWDGSPEAHEALEWAIQLAERTSGSVEVVQVLERTDDELAVRRQLEDVRARVAARVPATIDLRRGRPELALAGGAELDLLVLGSRGLGPLQRVVLGSVSASVLRHATCAVVVLPRGVHAPMQSLA